MSYQNKYNWKRKQAALPPKPKKERKLSPLLTEEQKQDANITQRVQ